MPIGRRYDGRALPRAPHSASRYEHAAPVAAVQRGLASGAVATGRLMPESERLVAHFHGLVVEAPHTG